MSLIIYLDGEFVGEENAKISVFDHGFLYGDGIFEGIRAYNGRVFRLDEHLERLYDSAKAIHMTIPISISEMEEVVLETLRRNNLRDAYIRLIVSRGKGDLGLDPRNCPRPLVLCIASGIKLYPPEFYENGMEVVTVPTRRNIPEGLNPRIKSLNYLNNILAKIEAIRAGVLEAVMLNQEGYVAECTGDNIFIIKKGKLITPPPHVGLLEGVTRNSVMELAAKNGIEVKETVFTRYDLYTADEMFLTGTAAEIIPVVRVDDRAIGEGKPGPVTQQLISKFHEFVRSEGTDIFK
ncbi:branched-chain-amino-acid transaminase [Heliophilum fasciatum]|uniref:Branched-chain-amino-acid aminotransferase n=1 Tax=Heliophilum fasciatum TaxID=35700 RepID=A0A4V2SX59_9FIRM|nr:branched-chain-amino-acid transaminase [Heliophilum fasciatum]MCW2277638.1 branched-chain amino acid aminotransferase [Heliophilum fasciatum]TCP64986.1 branched chain amino acid aminotransferase [Heliophilum fasciatum]